MDYKVFLYTIFCIISCAPVYCVTLSGIFENLQEEILHIARSRDFNDNDACDAMVSAVKKARAQSEEFYNSNCTVKSRFV